LLERLADLALASETAADNAREAGATGPRPFNQVSIMAMIDSPMPYR
jgi:hypothetical protein